MKSVVTSPYAVPLPETNRVVHLPCSVSFKLSHHHKGFLDKREVRYRFLIDRDD